MKWFKHDSNASTDAKIEKLIIKFGLEGYGLYFYCLELIAKSVEPHNLTFELEHDAEIIGHRVGLHSERVEEIMKSIIAAGLFEDDGGRITCLKLANRTDEYTQKVIKSRRTPDKVPTKSVLIEENRIDKNRIDKKKQATIVAFDIFWNQCPKKVDRKKAFTTFKNLTKENQQKAIIDFKKRYAGIDKQFIPNPTTYMNGERWNDEIIINNPAIRYPAKGDCNAWVKFALERNIKTKVGESQYDFEFRIKSSINKGQ